MEPNTDFFSALKKIYVWKRGKAWCDKEFVCFKYILIVNWHLPKETSQKVTVFSLLLWIQYHLRGMVAALLLYKIWHQEVFIRKYSSSSDLSFDTSKGFWISNSLGEVIDEHNEKIGNERPVLPRKIDSVDPRYSYLGPNQTARIPTNSEGLLEMKPPIPLHPTPRHAQDACVYGEVKKDLTLTSWS